MATVSRNIALFDARQTSAPCPLVLALRSRSIPASFLNPFSSKSTADQPSIARKIGVLNELGLGYLKLGHPSTILSGGEAQRVKLAGELGKLKRGKHNLYILDEPTTGLHFADIDRLLESLNRLVDSGHSVVVIEHNLDVIKTADYVIDLGPEGGHNGGQLIACGTPEEIAACKASYTGKFLAEMLHKWRHL